MSENVITSVQDSSFFLFLLSVLLSLFGTGDHTYLGLVYIQAPSLSSNSKQDWSQKFDSQLTCKHLGLCMSVSVPEAH